jgi:hypothetical protein
MASLGQAFGQAARTFANVYVSERNRQASDAEERRWKEFYARLAVKQEQRAEQDQQMQREMFDFQKERNKRDDERELAMLEAQERVAQQYGFPSYEDFAALAPIEQYQMAKESHALNMESTRLRISEIKQGMALRAGAAGRERNAAAERLRANALQVFEKTGMPIQEATRLALLHSEFVEGTIDDAGMAELETLSSKAKDLMKDSDFDGNLTPGQLTEIGSNLSPEDSVELQNLNKKPMDSWTPEEQKRYGELTSRGKQTDPRQIQGQMDIILEQYGTPTTDIDGRVINITPPTEGPAAERYNELAKQLSAYAGVVEPQGAPSPVVPLSALVQGVSQASLSEPGATTRDVSDVPVIFARDKKTNQTVTIDPKQVPGINLAEFDVLTGKPYDDALNQWRTDRSTFQQYGRELSEFVTPVLRSFTDNQLRAMGLGGIDQAKKIPASAKGAWEGFNDTLLQLFGD